MAEPNWTFHVHDEGQYAGINDGIRGETLLKIGGNPGSAGAGDTERVRQFEKWLSGLRNEIAAEIEESIKNIIGDEFHDGVQHALAIVRGDRSV
jgi:hypothetical protein